MLTLSTGLVYSLNCFNKIWQCAFIFTLLTLLINFITYQKGIKKTISVIFLATIFAFVVSMNKTYFIQGKPINGLFFASYFSVLVSLSMSSFFFMYLNKSKALSFIVSSFLTVIFAAIIDGLFMGVFFSNLYPTLRVINIFTQEVAYKALYGGLLCFVFKTLGSLFERKSKSADFKHRFVSFADKKSR